MSRWERGKLSWGWGHGLERKGQNGEPENGGPSSGIGDSKCHTNDPIFATVEPSSVGGRRVALGWKAQGSNPSGTAAVTQHQ